MKLLRIALFVQILVSLGLCGLWIYRGEFWRVAAAIPLIAIVVFNAIKIRNLR